MSRSIQHEVDRRVVAQLALAHELGQLRQGCDVNFTLDSQSQVIINLLLLPGNPMLGIIEANFQM